MDWQALKEGDSSFFVPRVKIWLKWSYEKFLFYFPSLLFVLSLKPYQFINPLNI